MRAQITDSVVTHRRHRQVDHAFRYRVFHLLIDVDQLAHDEAFVRGFGPRRPVAIRSKDHFGPASLPLRDKVAAWVAGQGAVLGDGPLLLWAFPRMLGHVFNPVSWWWSFHPDGRLAMAIAEVNNTFGDWHAYLLTDFEPRGGTIVARADKAFHVSPFLPIDGLVYEFAFRPPSLDEPSAAVVARLAVTDESGGQVFEAVQHGRPRLLTTRSLWHAVVRHPMVSLMTLARIHRQALALWRRRVTFHPRPEPPPSGLEIVRNRTGAAA